MTTILHIDSSAGLTTSKSRAKSAEVVNDLSPTIIFRRDLAADPVPFVDNAWINARLVPLADQTASDASILAFSDELVAELQAANTIVIGVPMYNFGCPAVLKAWMDLVARPKVTFKYENGGPVGLLADKKAIIVTASGGVPIGSGIDYLTPQLTTFLGFLGITDITIVPAT
jgi:FMN-dependent NADH-azoreductase